MSRTPDARPRARRRAFTLIELLVVISITVVLAGLVFLSFTRLREAGGRTSTSAALRNLGTAFNAYASDHEGAILPGYASAGDFGRNAVRDLGIAGRVRLGTGSGAESVVLDEDVDGRDLTGDSSSYVWRLASYLGNGWTPAMADYGGGSALVEQLSDELGASTNMQVYGRASAGPGELGISRIPSIGMNSIFVGGDDVHGPAAIRDRAPWVTPFEKLAAERVSEIRLPSQLMVYMPVRRWDAEQWLSDQGVSFGRELPGAPVAIPPFLPDDPSVGPDAWTFTAASQQWAAVDPEDEGADVLAGVRITNPGDWWSTGGNGGVPIARNGDQLPVAHADGSVTSLTLLEIQQEMRRWLPRATIRNVVAGN